MNNNQSYQNVDSYWYDEVPEHWKKTKNKYVFKENKEVVGDVNNQSVYEIWHGEKLREMREMHKLDKGFMNSEVCKRCYLPRKTRDDKVKIGDREIIVKNYINRTQIIGK